MVEFESRYSRRILVRLLLLTVILAGVLVAGRQLVADIYFRDQLTLTGLVINGAILGLFLIGLGRMIALLLRYAREERALGRFVRGMEGDFYHPVDSLDPHSLILQRYKAVVTLSKQGAPVNHSALASTLVANESTRLSLPRFINNILILTGVFGTIVSLSMALVGASDLLGNTGETSQMGLVIHGMSTALSTTMTAIICYLFYGYFYLKLQDAKTHLLSGLEQVTTLYLLPKYSHSADHVAHDLAGLVRSLRETAEGMSAAQKEQAESARQLRELIAAMQKRVSPMGEDLEVIKRVLREGFRLPAAGD